MSDQRFFLRRPLTFATPEPEPAFAIVATVAPRLATAAPFFFEPFFGALSFADGGGMSESAAASAAGLPGSGGAEGGGPLGPMPSLGADFEVGEDVDVEVVVVDDALGATPGGALGGIGACGAVHATNVELVLLLGDALGVLGGIGAAGGADAVVVLALAEGAVDGALGTLVEVASLAVFVASFACALSLNASLSPLVAGLPPPRPASSMFALLAELAPLPPLLGVVRDAMRVSVASSLRPGFERTTS